jgi:hypothetical protein
MFHLILDLNNSLKLAVITFDFFNDHGAVYRQMCILYNQRDATLYSILYYCQRSTCFGRSFRPSSGAHKTVYAALGIFMGSNPSTTAVDSRKAWRYPRLHIQFYKLLMMGGKTARNMYSVDNNKKYCTNLHLVGCIKYTNNFRVTLHDIAYFLIKLH